jgi:hypothetical protein
MSHPAYGVEPIGVVEFAEQICGIEVQDYQKRAIEMLATHERVVIRFGHQSQKIATMKLLNRYNEYIEGLSNGTTTQKPLNT